MYKRILVAIDGSPASRRGLKEAIRLAKGARARLLLLHVIDEVALVAAFPGALHTVDMVAPVREAGKTILARGREQAQLAGVSSQALLVESLEGSVAERIVREARRWRADLLVLGTHGRRGMRRMVMGSDAELVVREASTPVLLVRAPGRA